MPLLKLGLYQKKLPKLKDLLPQFDQYLEVALTTARERLPQDFDIVPAQAAKKLHVPEGLAFGLLMIAEEAGIVQSHYQIYCPTTDNFLAEFESQDETPAKIECPYHDSETIHESDEYFLEVVFRFKPHVLETNRAVAAHS
jgi:hypothetical protein